MFNFGFSEMLVIGALALIFIGPKELPGVARAIGRLLNEFKRTTTDITSSISQVKDQADEAMKAPYEQISKKLNDTLDESLNSSTEDPSKDSNHE